MSHHSNAEARGAAGAPSAQMQAVMRVLAGQEERTLAQKLADPNRPTWEQYKKDNQDKLNLEGLDQKKMEEYRQQLDAERDKFLSRGTNHRPSKDKKKKKKKRRKDDDSSDSTESSDSDSSSEEERRKRKHKRKRKRKQKKRHRRHQDDDGSSSSDNDDHGSHSHRKRKKHKHKKRRKSENDDGGESDGSHYRLSKFFEEE